MTEAIPRAERLWRFLAEEHLDHLAALDPENPRTNEIPCQSLQLGQIFHDGETDARLVGIGQNHLCRVVLPTFDSQCIAENRAGQAVLAAQFLWVRRSDYAEDLRQCAVGKFSSELE